jgi:hypothetical protein
MQECTQLLSVSCSTSSVRSSINGFAAVPYYILGKREKKEKSRKILVMLIAAMYVNQSILISINWYFLWLAYIKYGGLPEAIAVYDPPEDTPLIVVAKICAIIKLAIADSIMVFLF